MTQNKRTRSLGIRKKQASSKASKNRNSRKGGSIRAVSASRDRGFARIPLTLEPRPTRQGGRRRQARLCRNGAALLIEFISMRTSWENIQRGMQGNEPATQAANAISSEARLPV